MSTFHLYLISDSTGETLTVIARAVWARFALSEPVEHIYALTRTQQQIQSALNHLHERVQVKQPAMVMCTLVDDELKAFLEKQCQKLHVPCIPVLDQIAERLSDYLGVKIEKKTPGGQHMMDHAYFDRIRALAFALAHDDGQQTETLDDADVILLGLSRTSKTPTCFYLAHRGIKAANVPLVPDLPLPPSLTKLTRPLIIGLVLKPARLVQIRRQRFTQKLMSPEIMLPTKTQTHPYINPAHVSKEVTYATQLFHENNWPIIDVTQRSVEETAAIILNMKRERDEAPSR